MEKSYFFRKSITRAALLLIISTLTISCGNAGRKYYTHPDSYIVDQLANKRIIMLGDFAHSYPLPYQSLISLLNQWFEKVKTGESKDNNIVLVLETDPQIVLKLKEFISTGNWKPFLNYWLPYNSMEGLEFFADLRSLKMKIDRFNSRKNVTSKIKLDLLGPEAFNIFDAPAKFNFTTQSASIKYFIHTRDSLATNNIIRYLDNNKNRKAIIFYGAAHLIKNYVKKGGYGILPDSESWGYFLAHYLKKKFGDNSVLTINQIILSRPANMHSIFSDAADSNIFVYSDNPIITRLGHKLMDLVAPGERHSWQLFRPQNYDGLIIRPERMAPFHNISYIFSRNIIKADIKRITQIKNHKPGSLLDRYYNIALESLHLITGKNFKNPEEWENWIKKSNYDGMKHIDSKEFARQIFNEFHDSVGNVKLKRQLIRIGISTGLVNFNSVPSKDRWQKKVWPKEVNHIKYLNSIGLLWVGTSKEKQEARAFLEKYTGKNFSAPQDYLKYYRDTLYKVNY